MEIIEYTSEMQKQIAHCYNNLTANVPHCYPISEDELDKVLMCPTYETEDKKLLQSQKTFVASAGTNVPGFIQVGIGPCEKLNKNNMGVIRFFVYQPGERQVAQALLEKAENHLNAHTAHQIIAFPQDYRYRFYHFKYAYLSVALGQIQALLGYNGYERKLGEVFLAWNNYTVIPTEPTLEVELSVNWEPSRGERPNCTVQAFRDGIEIGICQSISGGEFSDSPNAQGWFHTKWLGITDEFQGQGLGRHLLQRTLQEMRDIGYQHAAISTDWENYRAFLFYSNFGYQVSDWTYGLLKIQP